jgi:hypothetical protein
VLFYRMTVSSKKQKLVLISMEGRAQAATPLVDAYRCSDFRAFLTLCNSYLLMLMKLTSCNHVQASRSRSVLFVA